MTVRVYKSTDASAPVLTGAVGSLVALLDAVLVNGYGSMTAAGWTIAYTATNKRDYLQASGHSGVYLDVDDSGPGGGGAREARMRGYETMSALATGTLAFPTAAQSSFGVVCRKSTTADATARPWYIVADGGTVYVFVDTGDFTNPSYSMAVAFGDSFSYKASDPYNAVMIGRNTENTNVMSADSLNMVANPQLNMLVATTYGGQYIDRHWNGTGGSQPIGKTTSALCVGGGNAGGSGGSSNYSIGGFYFSSMGDAFAALQYPNGPDAALELSPVWVFHNGSIRGYMKGLWAPCHRQPCGHGDTFSGTGNMSGKSFLALNMGFGLAGTWLHYGGQIVVETSDTWS